MKKLNVLSNTSIRIFRDSDHVNRVSVEDFAATLAYEKIAESIFGLPEVTVLSISLFVNDRYKNMNGVPYIHYIIETWDGIQASKYRGKIYENASITWDLDESL